MTVRLSAAERDILQKQDEVWLARPLGLGSDPRSMAAQLRHMVRLLQDQESPSPCSDAVRHLNAVFDVTVAATKETGLACRQGCAHCCQQPVTVSALEAFFVAAQIRNRPGAVAALLQAAGQPAAPPGAADYSPRPCPMLDSAACSIYAARPLACRGFVSKNVDVCIDFARFGKPNVPMPEDYLSVLHACRMILIAALRLSGLADAAYDMNAAVAAILAQDDAERHWLKGGAVFAGVPCDGPPPPDFNSLIDKMAAYVSPTL